MKLNVANPATGCQKLFEIDEEKKLRPFFEKRIASDVPADSLGDEWKGYIFRIAGGNDKQGFPMKQGVLTTGRVRLLLKKGMSCFRERRQGERKRKSVHGCIVDNSLSVLSLIVVKKGEQEIPGLTDVTIPRRLGPKRASKIRKLFNLSKEDDVNQYVVRRPAPKKPGRKPRNKAPKIQRLVTPETVARKNHMKSLRAKRITKAREDAAEYAKLLAQRIRQAKDRRRRSSGGSISKRESRSEAVEDKTGTGKGHMRELAKAFYNIGRQSISGKPKADKKKGKKPGKGLKGVKGGKVGKAKAGKAKKPKKPKAASTEKKDATSKSDASKAAPKAAAPKTDAPKKAPAPKKTDSASAAPKGKAGKGTGKKPAGKPASGAPASGKPASGKPASSKPASGKPAQKKEPAKK